MRRMSLRTRTDCRHCPCRSRVLAFRKSRRIWSRSDDEALRLLLMLLPGRRSCCGGAPAPRFLAPDWRGCRPPPDEEGEAIDEAAANKEGARRLQKKLRRSFLEIPCCPAAFPVAPRRKGTTTGGGRPVIVALLLWAAVGTTSPNDHASTEGGTTTTTSATTRQNSSRPSGVVVFVPGLQL